MYTYYPYLVFCGFIIDNYENKIKLKERMNCGVLLTNFDREGI